VSPDQTSNRPGHEITEYLRWVDAPYVAEALTVNIGDLMARWTGDRWRSTPHRVLPPPADAPHEELISLILFCKANSDTVIAPLPGSSGHTDYPQSPPVSISASASPRPKSIRRLSSSACATTDSPRLPVSGSVGCSAFSGLLILVLLCRALFVLVLVADFVWCPVVES
jgi:hypothetical protein